MIAAPAVMAGCGPSGGGDAGMVRADSGPVDLCSSRFALARRRPEIELVIDRSCAMTTHFDGSPGTGPTDGETRWRALLSALEALPPSVGLTGVGLVLSPDGPECSMPEPRIAPGSGTVTEALAVLDSVSGDLFDGCAVGPVAFGLEAGLNTIVLSDTVGASGDPYTLVIVGGAPGCGETADSLGPVGSDVASALEAIVQSRVSCVLDIVEGAPDPDMLRVWVDGAAVPADPDEGWSFSAGDNAITLNGAWCTMLTAGDVQQVTAAVGCDESRCVARPERCDGLDEDCDGTVDNDCS